MSHQHHHHHQTNNGSSSSSIEDQVLLSTILSRKDLHLENFLQTVVDGELEKNFSAAKAPQKQKAQESKRQRQKRPKRTASAAGLEQDGQDRWWESPGSCNQQQAEEEENENSREASETLEEKSEEANQEKQKEKKSEEDDDATPTPPTSSSTTGKLEPKILTFEELETSCVEKIGDRISGLSSLLWHRIEPVVQSLINKKLKLALDAQLATVVQGQSRPLDMIQNYRKLFMSFTTSPLLSFQTANTGALKNIGMRDYWVLMYFALSTTRRCRGDQLLQPGSHKNKTFFTLFFLLVKLSHVGKRGVGGERRIGGWWLNLLTPAKVCKMFCVLNLKV